MADGLADTKIPESRPPLPRGWTSRRGDDFNSAGKTIIGRVRGASVSLLNANPQLGMWQASGLAIAQAPNLSELRDAESGGTQIEFNSQGHSMRTAIEESDGELTLAQTKTRTRRPSVVKMASVMEVDTKASNHMHHHRSLHKRVHGVRVRRRALKDKHCTKVKAKWGPTLMNALKAVWKFVKTPSGFLITVYFLNIVGWGAMLFFLLLKAAPAMNHPDGGDADSSPRKIWIEIDSQILNALFCVTGFGLAPWRFRDLYWYIQARIFHNHRTISRLYKQNKSWFRPPAWATNEPDGTPSDAKPEDLKKHETLVTVNTHPRIDMPFTFTGERAPPTSWWKLAFVIWMMVFNTILQAVLSYYMWHYDRIARPVSSSSSQPTQAFDNAN